MLKPKVVIKKYPNRRLYDMTGSRYVNLDEVARMVRDGTGIQVLDAKTGEDVTRAILTQIIVDDSRGEGTALPQEFLRQLIVASDRSTREFLKAYLDVTCEVYAKAQEAFRERLSEAKTVAANPLEFMQRLFPLPAWPPRPEMAELEELRRRVRELEQRLEKRPPAASDAPRRRRKP